VFGHLKLEVFSGNYRTMKKLLNTKLSDLKFLMIQLILFCTFGLASLAKWEPMGIPDYFVDQFGDTWLALLPGSLIIPYYTIAISETAAFFLVLISLFRMEWVSSSSKIYLKYALILSLLIFVILGYGLRLTDSFDGAANAFFYFGVTLFALYLVEKESQ